MQLPPISVNISQIDTPEKKLQMLQTNLFLKFAMPFNKGNRKALVMTPSSDTAQYLYENLAPIILKDAHLHTGLVTTDIIKCTIPEYKPDFNSILTLFSPNTKAQDQFPPQINEEIDVLFATDCIPEGEDLHDCDCLINYDPPQHPELMTLRISLIKNNNSPNEKFRLVNYFPDIELENYL